MSDIEAIATLYQQVDNLLENLRDQAEGDQERNRIAYQQKLNEQACVVLAWGQLEAEIDRACRNAIRLGKSHEEWQYRRAWSLCDSENPRLSFRNRLTLVLDQWVQFYICKNFGGIANRTAFQPTFRRILPSRASPHTARWPKSAPGTAFCHEIADFGLEAP